MNKTTIIFHNNSMDSKLRVIIVHAMEDEISNGEAL